MSKVGQFFRESRAELKKVVWPSRDDVVSSVKVVIISTILIAIVLGLLDWGFTEAFRAIMKYEAAEWQKAGTFFIRIPDMKERLNGQSGLLLIQKISMLQ